MTAKVPKALASIRRKERIVYVSGTEDDLGAMVIEPLHDRIRSNSDEDEMDVAWRGSEQWDTSVERLEWLQDVTDLVVLLDDRIINKLRHASADDEALGESSLNGLELIVVLRRNEARSAEGEPLARVWMAKASLVQLIGLKRVAGRTEWNLQREDEEKRLHWLYPRNEKVLTGTLVMKKLAGDDETRLALYVDRFVGHKPPICEHCGGAHATPAPGGG
jgi:hypothetical protein